MKTPEVCPNCGADVPRDAKACPECGSSEETGWSEEAQAADLGLPDEDFDYEEFTSREFGQKREKSKSWIWIVAAILVLLGFLAVFMW